MRRLVVIEELGEGPFANFAEAEKLVYQKRSSTHASCRIGEKKTGRRICTDCLSAGLGTAGAGKVEEIFRMGNAGRKTI